MTKKVDGNCCKDCAHNTGKSPCAIGERACTSTDVCSEATRHDYCRSCPKFEPKQDELPEPPLLLHLLPCGTQTKWGKIAAVGIITGERFYWMVSAEGVISMMPADVVEQNESIKRGE